MEGHLFSSIFENTDPLEFPAIALLVSGGHTELVLVEGFDKFRIIGRTRDDAVGEAFDKVARLLDLPYPGGPKISELADRARERNEEGLFNFPRPMMKTNDFDFSYSGLKTSVLYAMQKLDSINTETKEDIALGFEEAAIEPLIYKTKKAIEEFGVRTIILGGGVSANTYLQSELNKLSNEYGLPLHLPKKDLSTDNAIMIAVAAYIRVTTNRETTPEKIIARGNLSLEA
jgi:N6-L-threonylcarbamoyladenine synthase